MRPDRVFDVHTVWTKHPRDGHRVLIGKYSRSGMARHITGVLRRIYLDEYVTHIPPRVPVHAHLDWTWQSMEK